MCVVILTGSINRPKRLKKTRQTEDQIQNTIKIQYTKDTQNTQKLKTLKTIKAPKTPERHKRPKLVSGCAKGFMGGGGERVGVRL